MKTIALTVRGESALDVVRQTLLAPPAELASLTPAQQRTMARLVIKATTGRTSAREDTP